MYESFYGLKEKPFQILPDPEYLYMSQGHENVYTHLAYAVTENKGFVVITGEVGSGKTTLINYLLNDIRQDIQTGLINSTCLSPTQFLRIICQEFELETGGMDKDELMLLFHAFLVRRFAEGKRVTLIIDEAQNLRGETLEEIRMLSNVESEKHHLIQIILLGQPELKDKLRRRELKQFVQRVSVHCHLGGLTKNEVFHYIRYRLQVGGAENLKIFRDEAIEKIYKYSGGIPRLINILCDTALVYGFAESLNEISAQIIDNVIQSRESGGIFSEKAPDDHPCSMPVQGSVDEHLRELLSEIHFRVDQGFGQIQQAFSQMEQHMETLSRTGKNLNKGIMELIRSLKAGMKRFAVTQKSIRKTSLAEPPPEIEEKNTVGFRWYLPAGVASLAAVTMILMDHYVIPVERILKSLNIRIPF